MTKQQKQIVYGLKHRNDSGANPLWRDVFDKLKIAYAFTDKGKLLQLRYVERANVTRICFELYISEGTFTNWHREILATAALWAAEYGLI